MLLLGQVNLNSNVSQFLKIFEVEASGLHMGTLFSNLVVLKKEKSIHRECVIIIKFIRHVTVNLWSVFLLVPAISRIYFCVQVLENMKSVCELNKLKCKVNYQDLSSLFCIFTLRAYILSVKKKKIWFLVWADLYHNTLMSSFKGDLVLCCR